MNTRADRLQKARGPLTGIALLLIGASIALYMVSTSSGEKTGTVISSSVPVDQTLAAPSTTTDFSPATTTAPATTVDTTGTSAPTTSPTTVTATTVKPAATTTLPTSTTPPAPTTTPQPAKVNWASVIPSLPNGGTASCVECTSYHYAINIAYPSYQTSALLTDMASVFQKAGWQVATSGSTITVSKTGIAGSVKVSSAATGSTAVLDLRSV